MDAMTESQLPEPPVPPGPFDPHAAAVYQLQPGDLVTVDPFFGLEQVVSVEELYLSAQAYWEGVRGSWPCKKLVLRFALPGSETNTRNVLRFPHEPITKWTPVS